MRFNAIAGFVGTVALVGMMSSLSVAEERERSGGKSERSDKGHGGDEDRNRDHDEKGERNGDRGRGEGDRHQDNDRNGKGDDWDKGGDRGDRFQ